MANTYTQIHIHTVFAVKYRQSLIDENWEAELYKYITAIIQNNNHKVLQINGMPDHIHIVFGMRPSQSLSELIKIVKQDSSKWINQQRFLKHKFAWQGGFGAFSYAKSELPNVIKYVKNQKIHHSSDKKTFLEEYKSLLVEHDIDYEECYIFQPV